MTYTIKLRRGTASEWSLQNPTLADGELGYEFDTGLAKIGDGETPWEDLIYMIDAVTGPPGDTGPQGPPGLVWKGPWDSTLGYDEGDLVTYDGSVYKANKFLAEPASTLPAYRGSTTAQGTTTYSIAVPTGTIPGDHLYLGVETNNTGGADVPDDWNLIDSDVSASSNQLWVYERVATVDDTPGSLIPIDNAGASTATLRAYSSSAVVKFVDAGNTATNPNVDTEADNHWVLKFQAGWFSSGNYPSVTSYGTDSGGVNVTWVTGYQHAIGSAHQSVAVAGPSGTSTWTWNNANGWATIAVEIKQAADPTAVLPLDDFDLVVSKGDTGDTGATGAPGADAVRGPVTINAQTGTAYTLVLADATKFVTMNNAGASILTVPANADVAFPIGTQIEGAQLGAGQVTIAAAAGVTFNYTPGLKVGAQYGVFGLMKIATNTWLVYGRLIA